MSPRTALSPAERRTRDRRLVLDVLGGMARKDAARKHRVSASRVDQLVREATPERARDEVAFWGEVEKLV